MENILKRITFVSGVIGTFVCSDDGDILADAFPGAIDARGLAVASHTVAQTLACLQMAKHARVSNLDLVYASGRFVIKRLQRGSLCIICIPNVNIPLLNVTAEVVARALVPMLKTATKSPTRAATSAIPVAHLSTVAGEALGTPGQRVLESQLRRLGLTAEKVTAEELSAVLPELEKAFAVFIGSARARTTVEAMRQLARPI